MQQHAFDYAVGPVAVLSDLAQVVGQHVDDFVERNPPFLAQSLAQRRQFVLQLVEQIERQGGEVVDEIERVQLHPVLPGLQLLAA